MKTKRTQYSRAILAAIAAFQEVDKGFDDYLAHDRQDTRMTAQMQKLAKTLADAPRIIEAMDAKNNSQNSSQK